MTAAQTMPKATFAPIADEDFADEELDDYLRFLRTLPAQKLYRVAAGAIARILAASMAEFGETLALRLRSVDI